MKELYSRFKKRRARRLTATWQCELCTRIALVIERTNAPNYAKGGYQQQFDIASYQSFRENWKCVTCRQLTSLIEQWFGGIREKDRHDGSWTPAYYRVDSSFVTVHCNFKNGRMLYEFKIKLYAFHAFDALAFEGDKHAWKKSKTVIDLMSICKALEKCNSHHAGTCHSIQDSWAKLDAVPQILVIDVEKQCLSFKPGSCQYVALSYVWGARSFGQGMDENLTSETTTINFTQLCRPGAFRKLVIIGALPATVQDSMLVVKSLGFRYLWVDRFCIIQDDPSHKHAQIQAMAAIYTNSAFTIAVCEGEHCNSGIPGVGDHRPRKDPFHRFEFNDKWRLSAPTKSLSIDPIGNSVYFKRGWTYQEWTLSNRILAFHDQTASWICRKTLENENAFEISHSVGFKRLQNVFSAHPDIETYARAVEAYSSRSLTYNEDTLVAFASIMEVMGRSMPGGIFYGLPEMFFDGALLWEPRAMGTLTRRKDLSGNICRQLPSWSFAGWEGDMTTSMWKMVYDYRLSKDGTCTKRERDSINLVPTTRMFKTSETSGAREEINNKFSISTPYQSGGESQYHQTGDVFQLKANTQHFSSATEGSFSPVLEFRTRRLFASVAGTQHERGYSSRMIIRDQQGNPEGLVNPHEACPDSFEAELIQLSHASTRMSHFQSGVWRDVSILLKNRGDARYYFVLSIGWEDGIAYRRGIGWVSERYWDAAKTEVVDVRLG